MVLVQRGATWEEVLVVSSVDRDRGMCLAQKRGAGRTRERQFVWVKIQFGPGSFTVCRDQTPQRAPKVQGKVLFVTEEHHRKPMALHEAFVEEHQWHGYTH